MLRAAISVGNTDVAGPELVWQTANLQIWTSRDVVAPSFVEAPRLERQVQGDVLETTADVDYKFESMR